MKRINELDSVALTSDLSDLGLKQGDVGAVVMIHDEGAGYEVEFVGYDGRTIALLTLDASQIRPLSANDIPHVRTLAAA